MQESEPPGKVKAIFQLREAAEKKALAERDLDEAPSRDQQMALLDAKMELDEKTQAAIEACHECGHGHGLQEPHGLSAQRTGGDNVVNVDFMPADVESEDRGRRG
jgi:hypothetical protein